MARKSIKKKNKRVTTISRLIFGMLLLLSIVFFGTIILLNVIPKKYLLPIIFSYILYLFISFVCQCKLKNKVEIKYFFDFISCILLAIVSFGIFYMYKTMNFMDIIGAKNYELENYYIISLKDSYDDIKDVDSKLIGSYSNTDNYIKALNDLDKKINFKEKHYDNFEEASLALLNGDIDALFMSQTHKDMADEQISNFNNSVEVLYTISIKIPSKVVIKNVDVTEDPFNIYISGIDVYGDIASLSRSDVNMIVTVNPKTHEVLLTSIPRDYYVQLHNTTGYKDKLTHAGTYGIDMSIATIEDLLDISINYYIRVNFTTLISMVDSIGGIDVYSDASFTAYTNKSCKYKVGTNHLNGKCALAFTRERYAYKEGDRHRVENQQAVITAIMNKTLSSKILVTKYTNILKSLGSSFQTNMPQEQIYSLVNMQLDNMPNWDISNYSLDGTDGRNYTYSYSGSKLYVMNPDYTTVVKARELINKLMESE